jgi:hypothetical protein
LCQQRNSEEQLAGLVGVVDERERPGGDLIIDRFHPLLGQRAGVLDMLLADLAEARVHGRVVLVRRLALQEAAGPNRFLNSGFFG